MNNEIPQGKYPGAYYRVSLKAIIENERGEVLCVKENGGDWSLPGGGMDHGETPEQALERELYEEAAIDQYITRIEPQGIDSIYLPTKEGWLLWAIYRVTFMAIPPAAIGEDGDEVAYLDPQQFKDSDHRAHQLIYKWCVDQTHPVTRY